MSGADAERGADPALVVAGLQRPLAIALVYLRAQGGGDFFADTPFCLAASELRAAGHSAKVYEVFFASGPRPFFRRQQWQRMVMSRCESIHLV